MRLTLAILILPLVAFGQSFTVTVSSNGVIRFPTNLFAANSNALVAVTGTGGGGGGSGTVTSVGLTMPAGFNVANSPVTTSGTLAVTGTLAVGAGGTGITNTTAAGQALLAAADAAAQRTALALGTAATNNVPASGNAASGEVVLGSDTRLTDARTPTAHTHPATAISDSTTAGRALLTAADVAAQRTALAVTNLLPGTGIQFSGADITHNIEAGTNIVLTTNGTALVVNSTASGGTGGTTNLVSSSTNGLAPQATLANAVLGTDGSTNVAWRSWTIDAGRVAFTNTVAETTIFEEILPAGILDTDYQALQFDVMGVFRNDVGTAQGYRVRFYVNGTAVYSSASPTIGSVAAAKVFFMNGRWVRTASTALDLYGTHTVHGGTAPTTGSGALGATPGVPNSPFGARGASCDWSASVTIKMTVELTAASTALWMDLNWRIYR
jgi:hypothetical protein